MKKLIRSLPLFLLVLSLRGLVAGPYAPAAGLEGSEAISKDDTRITRWAEAVSSYQPGEDVDLQWQNVSEALGPASDDALDVVCLGRGGSIILEWESPILDRPGADFAIFENAFSDGFLELAYVEVSSDGEHFVRFPNESQTAAPVGGFGFVDPTKIDGFAGKYRLGFGTPFDLADLPESSVLDRAQVRFIRLVDVIGDGSTLDFSGNVIYDPYPTFGTAGFDLQALGIFGPPPLSLVETKIEGEQFCVTWGVAPGKKYEVQRSDALREGAWQAESSFTAAGDTYSLSVSLDVAAYFRLRELVE